MWESSLQPIVAFIGHPVAGVPAQFMFEKAFAHHDLDWRFLSCDVAPEHLEASFHGMRALGFAGAWFDAAFGPAVAAWLDETIDAKQGPIAAVDAFTRRDGRLIGFHAGSRAVADLLIRQEPVEGRTGALLGSGQLARTVAAVLAHHHVECLYVLDPDDPDAATRLVESLRTHFPKTRFRGEADLAPHETPDRVRLPHDLRFLIQTHGVRTAEGAGNGKRDPSRGIDWSQVSPGTMFLDTDISLSGSRTTREAREAGLRMTSGLDCLIEQAIVIFRTWTGFEPDPAILRDAAEEFLEL